MSKHAATNTRSRPVFIDEDQVKQLLDWNEARYAIEQSFVSVSNQARDPVARFADQPVSSQPARTFVQAEGGKLCVTYRKMCILLLPLRIPIF